MSALGVEQPSLLQEAQDSTTVLATESATPNTRPAPNVQPCSDASAMPSGVATTICTSAPGTAMARTESSSLSENCNPTPNISKITPMSARSLAIR